MAEYLFSRKPVDVPFVRTKNRLIKTAIPCPGTEQILLDLERYESRSMQGQMPIVWDRAEDFSVYDQSGNKWIDLTSTIFVTNVGHANPRVLAAIRAVMERPLLHTYAYANELRAVYIKKLIEFGEGNFQKTFLLSAGTEATEAALKLMRMYGQKKKKRRLGIVCIEGGWHGRTMGAQMMGGNVAQKTWIGYQDQDIHHIPFPYPWIENIRGDAFFKKGIRTLEEQGIDVSRDICGFMLETFQGWGAVFYPKDFVQAVRALCDKNDIILTFDEMQAGFARTGKKFGYQHYDVKPDLICCGKGMGSGMPISGVLGSAEIMDLPEVGNMSSTHSANPLGCAAALATLKEIEDKHLVEESARKGKLLHEKLNDLKTQYPEQISMILGKGMVAAILFKKADGRGPETLLPSRVSERCLRKGVLVVHTGRESIKIGPPLTITDEALVEAIDVIGEAIEEVLKTEKVMS